MKKLLLLTLLFTVSLLANQVIYLNYDEVPKRVVKGEISRFSIKSLSTQREHQEILYNFENAHGIKILDPFGLVEKKGKYTYTSFHFLATQRTMRLPDVTASLSDTDAFEKSYLQGMKVKVITLNPKKDFSNIIANGLELLNYKTTVYDKEHNIVIFVLKAENSYIKAIHFKNVKKQGIESLKASYKDSKVTYFVVINKQIDTFSFSYFNLLRNKFLPLNIPIVVEDDSVVTQSDLKPKDQSHELLKAKIAAGVALFGFIFILWRKKYIYLIFILIPLAYIAYLSTPQQEICVKEGSELHLLPVNNGTIFQKTQTQQTFTKEGSAKDFTKIKLKNEKIGWVKNEDICSY